MTEEDFEENDIIWTGDTEIKEKAAKLNSELDPTLRML